MNLNLIVFWVELLIHWGFFFSDVSDIVVGEDSNGQLLAVFLSSSTCWVRGSISAQGSLDMV